MTKHPLEPFDREAIDLLQREHIKPTVDDVKVLADDLLLVADCEWPDSDINDITARAASKLLMSRVRPASLKSYLETLHAGKKA